MAGVSALMRKQRVHREKMDEQRKKKFEKRERIKEMLLKHKEANPDNNVTHIQGWELNADNELIRLEKAAV